MPVTIPSAFSMNGRLPPSKKPAINPQPARQRLSSRTNSSGWSCHNPVAQVIKKYVSDAGRAHLDQLGAGADFAQGQDAGRGPPP